MKYAPSALIGRLSRSAGSTTASHNRYGAYLRNRVIPTNPATSPQTAQRVAFSDISIAWRNLTQEQLDQWNAFGPEIVRTDSLGESYTLNGQTAFMYVNRNRVLTGQALLSVPPDVDPAPALLTAIATIEDTPTMSIAYTATPLGANDKLLVFATRGVSAGRSFMPNGEYKLIFTSAAAAASPANVLAGYTAVFGTPVLDEKIFFKLKVIRQTKGQNVAPLQISGIVIEGS